MKVKNTRNLIKDLEDEVDIEVNKVWEENKQDLTPVACDAFYHEKDNNPPSTLAWGIYSD